MSANMTDKTSGTEKHERITAVFRYGGGRANINSSAFNKLCAGRQFSVSNPPERKAAKRYIFSQRRN